MSTLPVVPLPPAAPDPLPARPDPAAIRLGHAGLAPFVLAALLAGLVREEVYHYVALGLAAYAGAIVAFLGGIHWGFGMHSPGEAPRTFRWAAVPAAVAWLAVMMPPDAGLVVLGAMLVVCYLVDRRAYAAHGLAGWMTLRFRLTAVASLCCFIVAALA